MKKMLIAASVTGALVAGLILSFRQKRLKNPKAARELGKGQRVPERSMQFTMG